MIKLKLYPPSGTREQSNSIKFEIENVTSSDFNLRMENGTHSLKIDITALQDMSNGSYMGFMNLNIPEHASQSAISIFAYIEEPQSDGSYHTVDICPSIFTIVEEEEKLKKSLTISPLFISQKDLCSVVVDGIPNDKYIFSINDKIFKIIINEEGKGLFNFRGRDIVGDEELESLNKLPVYLYRDQDNYTIKEFSGSYLNILPSKIALHATIDPRCDTNSPAYVDPPGSWERPEECDDDPDYPGDPEDPDECNPLIEICPDPFPCVSFIDIPTSCDEGNVVLDRNICRIHNNSVVLLNNGMVLQAYTSPDKTYETDVDSDQYNINRVFLTAHKTTIDVQVIATGDVIIESRTSIGNFQIHVSDDIYNAITISPSLVIYIVFYNDIISFQKVKIIGKFIDEYTGEYILEGESGDSGLILNDWLFCVNAVLYYDAAEPVTDIYGDEQYALSYVRNEFETGAYVKPINVTIASNKEYVGVEEEIYVYLIVEAITENNLSQLYFNSLKIGSNSEFTTKEIGWERITNDSQGNNRNPKAMMDAVNNLHVVFESDRGGISQLYYGVIGDNYIPMAASAFSSSIDKYSELLAKSSKPFDYFKPLLLKFADEYTTIPEFDTQDLVSGKWNIIEKNGGNVSESASMKYLNDLTISSNPVSQESMAFTSLEIFPDNLTGDPSVDSQYLQYNYQISFTLSASANQTSDLVSSFVVKDREMDIIFNAWKDDFVVSVDTGTDADIDTEIVNNQPIYAKNYNKFMIGKSDKVFDRIIPLVGSYRISDPSDPEYFKIKILKADNNLKDFTFGLMLEKVYFKATNLQTLLEFINSGGSENDFVEEELETIYTGKAKIVAFIRNDGSSLVTQDYIIIREFPEIIDISDESLYEVIANYVRITPKEAENVINTHNVAHNDKFLGTVTLLINNVPRFSQSFISELNDEYNSFDVGFGVPDGGCYVADKMSPSKMGVFDNVDATLYFTDISITSPIYNYNDNVVSLPSTVRDMIKLRTSTELPIVAPDGTSPYDISEEWGDELLTLNFRREEEIKFFAQVLVVDPEDFSEKYDVSNVEKVTIEFVTYTGRSDKMIVQSGAGVILHDTGFVLSTSDDPITFDVDVTFLNDIYIIVELGPDFGNRSYNFTAYFKKVYSENSFLQVPITFEGVNQSADIDVGICNDMHIAWQSNRDKHWNIFYMNSVNELSPFRYETQITNVESNSIKPNISVNRNGTRMIIWDDNRRGNYSIYAARSLEWYDCNQKQCEKKMIDAFEGEVDECRVSMVFTPAESGNYMFKFYFYSDSGLNKLYKVISMSDTASRWSLNGDPIVNNFVYDEDNVLLGVGLGADTEVTIAFVPDKEDDIFDIVLYAKLVSLLVEGE